MEFRLIEWKKTWQSSQIAVTKSLPLSRSYHLIKVEADEQIYKYRYSCRVRPVRRSMEMKISMSVSHSVFASHFRSTFGLRSVYPALSAPLLLLDIQIYKKMTKNCRRFSWLFSFFLFIRQICPTLLIYHTENSAIRQFSLDCGTLHLVSLDASDKDKFGISLKDIIKFSASWMSSWHKMTVKNRLSFDGTCENDHHYTKEYMRRYYKVYICI